MSYHPIVVAFIALLAGQSLSIADDWPQFRGPTGDGITQSRNLPLTWSETNNIIWKVAIPGRGHSSPVILGNRIWLTTAVETNPTRYQAGPDEMQRAEHVVLSAMCLDRATGKLIYHTELFPVDNPVGVHLLNSYATPTPVVEPGRLYCDFGTFGTACLNAATGQVIWKRQLPIDHQVGPGSSIILFKNLLVLVRDGCDLQYVTALDKTTGAAVWKTDRPPISGDRRDMRKAFHTPQLIEVNGLTQMIVPGAQWVVSYEPATGKELWRVNGSGFSGAPRPLFGQGMVFICTGNAGGRPQLWAIRVDGQGDVTQTHVAWKLTTQIPMVPTPILLGKELYLINDDGFVSCVDALTGQVLGKARAGGNYVASPIYAEGRNYFFSREGKTIVLKADKELTLLAENQLEGAIAASPAVVGSALYLRTDKSLYCIKETGKPNKR